MPIPTGAFPLPILLYLKSPVKLQVRLVVVVNELGNGTILATAQHARGRSIGFEFLFVFLLVGSIWRVRSLIRGTSTISALKSRKGGKGRREKGERKKEERGKKTHNHLLHLILQRSPAHDLHILQSTQNLMMDLKSRLHPECGAFLDGEGVVLEIFERAGLFEIDDDVWAAFDFEAERFDDDFAGVFGVADGGACAQAEGLFPFAEGFVVLVWEMC